MKFTDQQEIIFANGTEDHAKIIAGAGAGKTTSLKELQKRTKRRALYCPFNKTIADEAQKKFVNINCSVKTLHAFAWNAVRHPDQRPHQGGASDVRAAGIMRKVSFPRVAGFGDYRLAGLIAKTVTKFCISDSPRIGPEHAEQALMESVGNPAALRDKVVRERAEATLNALSGPLADAARLYMRYLVDEQKYTHDVYLKILDLSPSLLRTAFAGFQVVYKDEAQDSNGVEMSILQKAGIPIISVGDPYQQLYSWRGAQNALDLLPGRTMYLTESFRFGPTIADQGMQVLNALPVNKPSFTLIGAGDGVGRAHPANAMICRTNTGVIDGALWAARKGYAYYVDNADSLVTDLQNAESFRDGQPPKGLFAPFADWDEAIAEAEAGDRSLERLIKIVEEGRANEVIRVINRSIKEESNADMTIMTAHRSKGREFPFVKLGDDWKPLYEVKKRWEKAKSISPQAETLALEEYHALYVAVTRAQVKTYGLNPLVEPERMSPEYD